MLFLFEGWFDVVFFLCGFGYAVCYKVNTQTDDPTKEDVTECPAINGLPQYDVLELVVLGLDSNTLPVQFFPLYLHHGRQGHIRIGLFLVGDGDGFCHTTAADGDGGVSTRHNSCARTEQRGYSHNADKYKYFSHVYNLFRLYISCFDFNWAREPHSLTHANFQRRKMISRTDPVIFAKVREPTP